MKKLSLSLISLLFLSCSSNSSDKEIELLKKENELLKREQSLNTQDKNIKNSKAEFVDWSGTYSTYSEEVDYNATVYYNGNYRTLITGTGRQTYFSVACDCTVSNDLLNCYYSKTMDGNILGEFDKSKPIFVLKKVNDNSFKGYFNKYKIQENFNKSSLPIDSVILY